MSTEFLDNIDTDIDDILAELGEKVHSLRDKRQEIVFAEEKLKELKQEETGLSQEEIPQILLSRGLSSIKLSTGEKVDIVEILAASMPKDPKKKSTVMTWLVKNQGEHLIKRELTVEEPEEKIVQFLRREGIPYLNELKVNTNSFKAFLRQGLGMKKGSLQVLEIGDIPKECNPYVFKRTDIK